MMNTRISILYLLRNNENIAAWAKTDSPPWTLERREDVSVIVAWPATLGIPQPTIAELEAVSAAAKAWWATYQYTVKETPQWLTLKTDIAAANATLALYDLTALTNSIAQVTDAKSKAALQDVKACIKQAHDEAQALLKIEKDLKTILGKYLQVEPRPTPNQCGSLGR